MSKARACAIISFLVLSLQPASQADEPRPELKLNRGARRALKCLTLAMHPFHRMSFMDPYYRTYESQLARIAWAISSAATQSGSDRIPESLAEDCQITRQKLKDRAPFPRFDLDEAPGADPASRQRAEAVRKTLKRMNTPYATCRGTSANASGGLIATGTAGIHLAVCESALYQRFAITGVQSAIGLGAGASVNLDVFTMPHVWCGRAGCDWNVSDYNWAAFGVSVVGSSGEHEDTRHGVGVGIGMSMGVMSGASLKLLPLGNQRRRMMADLLGVSGPNSGAREPLGEEQVRRID